MFPPLIPSLLGCSYYHKGIHTILRNKDCPRRDFIFFIDRLSTLLVEYALQHLPYVPMTVVTPVGVECHGKKSDARVRLSYCSFRRISSDFNPLVPVWSHHPQVVRYKKHFFCKIWLTLQFQWRSSRTRVPKSDP